MTQSQDHNSPLKRFEIPVEDWVEGTQISGQIVIGEKGCQTSSDGVSETRRTQRDEEPFILALELKSFSEQIPEGCAPDEFGEGPHYLYPFSFLTRDKLTQLRDACNVLLG